MGGYSLVNAEMILLRKATEVGHYNHYHLLSGQDLPIQSQETIQKFFLKNSDKEFVGFDKDIFTYGDRVYYRYFFQELAGKRKSILKSVDKFLLKMQKKLNIKRNENIEFQKGAQKQKILTVYWKELYLLCAIRMILSMQKVM